MFVRGRLPRNQFRNKIRMEFAAPATEAREFPMRHLTRLLLITLPLTAGCRCGDRPGLFDRLFHRDEDCPSSRAAASAPCPPPCPPLAAPVSYSSEPMSGPITILPNDNGSGFAQPTPTNELPQGSRIPPTPTLPGGR